MALDKKAYDMDYAKQNITRKHIPFNLTNKEDADLLAWLNKQGNVTQYVKHLIREDINRQIENITIPAVDGFRDEAAIDDCVAKDHARRVIRSGNWEACIDIDARRVLTVNKIRPTIL